MERREQVPTSFSVPVSSSSSPFTSELFGSRKAPVSSSSGILGSILEPSSKVVGRDSTCSAMIDKKVNPSNPSWNKGTAPVFLVFSDYTSRSAEGENQSEPDGEGSSIYQDQKVLPSHLCSSIYYGGQDIYFHPKSNAGSPFNNTVKRDVGLEDDSGIASRGNWWQGSLYY